jgi:hypothetical protein
MAMNIDTVKKLLDAIEAGDQGAMAEVCKQLVAEAASGGEAAPPSDAVPPVAKVEPASGADGGYSAPADDARRGKGVEPGMDPAMARARKAIFDGEAEIKAALALVRPAAKEQIVTKLRARLGAAFTPAAEAEIMAAGDVGAAQLLSNFAEKLLGGGNAGVQRARSDVEHDANPGPAQGALPTVDALRAEGAFNESWLTGYAGALRAGSDVAAAFLAQGRSSTRARKAAPTQNGGQ